MTASSRKMTDVLAESLRDLQARIAEYTLELLDLEDSILYPESYFEFRKSFDRLLTVMRERREATVRIERIESNIWLN